MSSLYLRKYISVDAQEQEGHIQGYASTYDVDHEKDRFIPGAFTQSLFNWQKKGRWPHLYWEHDQEEILGFFKDVKEDTKGLFVQGKLFLDIPSGQKAQKAISKGKIGLSIGFYLIKSSYDAQGIRCLHDVDLREISLVSRPCNPHAKLDHQKSIYQELEALKQALQV